MTETRPDYIAGLRALAAALEADDTLPLPWDGTGSELSVFTSDKAECAAYARLLGRATKEVDDGSTGYGFRLHGSLHGMRVIVYARRDQVCTKVVKGVREVTREVPDPDALAAVPTTTVTETVEDVEWVCEPLLAAVSA